MTRRASGVPVPFLPSRKDETSKKLFAQTPRIAMLKMRDPTSQRVRHIITMYLSHRIRLLHAAQPPSRPPQIFCADAQAIRQDAKA